MVNLVHDSRLITVEILKAAMSLGEATFVFHKKGIGTKIYVGIHNRN